MKGTFVEGIGPPLEQIEKDYAEAVKLQNGGPTPERDALVLIRSLLGARAVLEEIATYADETTARAWVPAKKAFDYLESIS